MAKGSSTPGIPRGPRGQQDKGLGRPEVIPGQDVTPTHTWCGHSSVTESERDHRSYTEGPPGPGRHTTPQKCQHRDEDYSGRLQFWGEGEQLCRGGGFARCLPIVYLVFIIIIIFYFFNECEILIFL